MNSAGRLGGGGTGAARTDGGASWIDPRGGCLSRSFAASPASSARTTAVVFLGLDDPFGCSLHRGHVGDRRGPGEILQRWLRTSAPRGASDANSLAGTGRTVFSVGVAAIGASLALAALARLPLRKRVHLYSRQSMAAHIDHVVAVRGVLLRLAAVLFAFGLVVAGLAPLF